MFEFTVTNWRVASICPRKAASWIAAATTFALSVMWVATRAKRAWPSSAFKDSTVRRLSPNTSGT